MNNMSDIIKADFSAAIEEGFTSLEDMLKRIESYHIHGKLTDEEKDTLFAEARAKATDNIASVIDVTETLAAFGKRLSDLEAAVAALQKTDHDEEQSAEYQSAEYVPGKWYYDGDKATFEGVAYTCNAPANFPVVWSPSVTPQYWTAD